MSLNHSINHSITQSITQSTTRFQSLNHPVSQSLYYSITQSITPSLNHSLSLTHSLIQHSHHFPPTVLQGLISIYRYNALITVIGACTKSWKCAPVNQRVSLLAREEGMLLMQHIIPVTLSSLLAIRNKNEQRTSGRLPNAVSMLPQRQRRWGSIGTALNQCLRLQISQIVMYRIETWSNRGK